ncbi:MAG: HAD hydrolase family protein, partial [Tannerellaceae bacterium]
IDKAYSLQKLLDHLKMDKEEMMACGDGFNDLSMIRFAGFGVAMANAQDAVKEVSDFITLSNEEDGVAHVVERFIL